jgi:four helix bundle protein
LTNDLFNFEKFEPYLNSIEFVDAIFRIIKNFSKTEQYGITSQLKRSALSISLNIADGFGRYHKNDKNRFYRIAKG